MEAIGTTVVAPLQAMFGVGLACDKHGEDARVVAQLLTSTPAGTTTGAEHVPPLRFTTGGG